MLRSLALLCLLCWTGAMPLRAQCPSKPAFQARLQKILTLNPIARQKPALQKWLMGWQGCYPKSDSVYVDALLQLSTAQFYRNDFAAAIATAKQVLPLYRQPNPALRVNGLVRTQYLIGVYYNSNGQNTEAIGHLKQGVDLGKTTKKSEKYVANCHLYLVYAYFVKGDFEKALMHADLGGNLSLVIGDSVTSAKLWEQKGQVLNDVGRHREARTELEKAIRILRHYPNEWFSLANQHRLLGTILYALGQPDDELKELNIAYRLAEKNKHPNLSDFLNTIGYHYYKQKNYQQAVVYYEKGLEVNKSEYSKVNLYDYLGRTHSHLGNYQKALDLYQRGIATMFPGTRPANLVHLPQAQTIRSIAQKDYLLSIIRDKADTWLDWAKATKDDSFRLQNALRTYALADTMIDFMRWEHTGQQSKLFWRSKTHRLYEQAIETAFRLNDAASAFHFMEKSRAVLLNDKLNELGANRQLAQSQLDEERQLRQRVVGWQTKVATEKANTPTYAKALDSLRTAQEQQETFVKNLERTNPAYYRYKYDNQTIPLSQVKRELLKRKASLLTYFIGDSILYALSVTPTGTRLLRLPAAAYTKPAAELLTLNADPNALNQHFTHYLALSNQLYRALLAPLKLPSGRVIVSPDGVLLPFETLSTSATKPDFLVNKYAFSYAYSLNQLFKEPTDTGNKTGWFGQSGTFLGIAPVAFSARLGQIPLSGSDAVLGRIGGQFSAPALLTGTQATRRAFGEQAGQYRIIQLFTHADADSTDREPTLFFADSTLRLSELTNGGQISAELVGLSACKTGIGANQRGEGVFSLARGFAALGVPSVLTTLWNVENKATYDLTELFYAKLAEGLPKDVALQQAKMAYLADADRSDQLPNRWAGLLLVGNAEPIEKQLPIDKWVGGFGIAAGLAGAWWFHRRRQRLR
jgi:CHAT domain-containing protein/tetratricopeptide (TPR) repeat protein